MRDHDWKAKLTDYVTQAMRTEFRPGQHDCALFAAGAVQAMTGDDHARGFRGYRTLAAGRRKLADKGFADHVALAASLFEEIPPAFAQAGDLAVVAGDEDQGLGVVQGEAIYVLRHDGLGLVQLTDAVRAFRV